MSNAGPTRPRTETERGPTTTFGAHSKSRGAPPSRVSAKERPLSSGEVIPEDSASNVGGRQTASGSYRTNGTSTILGKRTERVRETTREKLQLRTKSPAKPQTRGGVNGEDTKSQMPSKQGNQAANGLASEQAPKKTLRRSQRASQSVVLADHAICSALEPASHIDCAYDCSTGLSHLPSRALVIATGES